MIFAQLRLSSIARTSAFALFALLAVLCASKTLANLVAGFRRHGVPCEVTACRSMARLSGEARLALPVVDVRSISPADRTRLISASWETIPRVVEPIEWRAVAFWRGNVLVPSYAPCDTELRLRALGFSKSATNGFEVLWVRSPESLGCGEADAEAQMELELLSRRLLNESVLGPEPGQKPFEIHVPSGICDLEPLGCVGVAVVLGALVALWLKLRDGPAQCAWAITAGTLAFVATCMFAVCAGLAPPNGLGVYVGKAKILLANMGVPPGFWTSDSFSVYQPAYPPGMVAFPLFVWLLSGSVSEVSLQLIVPGILAVLCAELMSGVGSCHVKCAVAGCWANRIMQLVLVACYIASPLTFRMAAGFYAEPMTALCLVVGWRAVLSGNERKGWILVGMAAFFRPEGLVYVVALCLSVLCARLLGRSHVALTLPMIAFAVLPGTAWKLFCVVVGAEIPGFDFHHFVACVRIVEALRIVCLWVARNISSSAGFMGLAVLLSMFRWGKLCFPLVGCAAWLIAMALGLAAFGFSTSSDFGWAVETALPRFLWTAASPWVAMVLDEQGFNLSSGRGSR